MHVRNLAEAIFAGPRVVTIIQHDFDRWLLIVASGCACANTQLAKRTDAGLRRLTERDCAENVKTLNNRGTALISFIMYCTCHTSVSQVSNIHRLTFIGRDCAESVKTLNNRGTMHIFTDRRMYEVVQYIMHRETDVYIGMTTLQSTHVCTS